jgi:hypothetical protein
MELMRRNGNINHLLRSLHLKTHLPTPDLDCLCAYLPTSTMYRSLHMELEQYLKPLNIISVRPFYI